MPQDVQRLMTYLGTNPNLWPQDRLINLPSGIDVRRISERIAEAVRIAELKQEVTRLLGESVLAKGFA